MTKESMVVLVIVFYLFVRIIFIEPSSIEVTKYHLSDESLAGIRVAFLSDFHLKRNDYKRLDKIVKLTNAQKPDLVLLGGDFAGGSTFRDSINPNVAGRKLSLINAPVLAVLGDSDWNVEGQKVAAGLTNYKIAVLENKNRRLIIKNRYVDIIGVADYSASRPDVAASFYKTAVPRIVITHNPDVYYDIIEEVNLIFAGHTHGGQFILPFTKPLFVPSRFGAEFASGLITKTRNKMIISKGLGTSILPVRFNCKPEIIVVEFGK